MHILNLKCSVKANCGRIHTNHAFCKIYDSTIQHLVNNGPRGAYKSPEYHATKNRTASQLFYAVGNVCDACYNHDKHLTPKSLTM
jgi:hypothetical protein